MKVLYVVNSSGFFCSHFLTLAKKVHEEGCKVYVIAGDDIERKLIEQSGLNFFCINLSRSGKNPFREIFFLYQLRAQIIKIRPDIIHTFTVKPIIYTGLVLKATLSKIVVCNSITGLGSSYLAKGIFGRCIWFFIKFLYKTALSIPGAIAIFENKDDKDLFLQWGLSSEENSRIVNGAGIDTSIFLPSQIKNKEITVVLVARLLKDKGISEYITAASALKEMTEGVRFQLVGDIDSNNISSMSYEMIKSSHDKGCIEWLGRRDNIAEIYASAHIACLPSYREGLPKSLIEAASCGLPIITTDVPGCRQMVKHGDNGLLIPPHSSEAIVEAVKYLIAHPEVMERMAESSRSMAINKFDHAHVIKSFFDIYKLT